LVCFIAALFVIQSARHSNKIQIRTWRHSTQVANKSCLYDVSSIWILTVTSLARRRGNLFSFFLSFFLYFWIYRNSLKLIQARGMDKQISVLLIMELFEGVSYPAIRFHYFIELNQPTSQPSRCHPWSHSRAAPNTVTVAATAFGCLWVGEVDTKISNASFIILKIWNSQTMVFCVLWAW